MGFIMTFPVHISLCFAYICPHFPLLLILFPLLFTGPLVPPQHLRLNLVSAYKRKPELPRLSCLSLPLPSPHLALGHLSFPIAPVYSRVLYGVFVKYRLYTMLCMFTARFHPGEKTFRCWSPWLCESSSSSWGWCHFILPYCSVEHIFFIHSSIHGCLGWFYILVIESRAVVNRDAEYPVCASWASLVCASVRACMCACMCMCICSHRSKMAAP